MKKNFVGVLLQRFMDLVLLHKTAHRVPGIYSWQLAWQFNYLAMHTFESWLSFQDTCQLRHLTCSALPALQSHWTDLRTICFGHCVEECWKELGLIDFAAIQNNEKISRDFTIFLWLFFP